MTDSSFETSSDAGRWLAALAAAAMLAVGMGLGRFAFTGMYPVMVRDGLLSVQAGSWAASANYAGYLAGALLLSRAPISLSPRLCKWSMVGTVICLAAMALEGGAWLAIAIRALAGIFNAIAMIAASAWLLSYMGYGKGVPVLYAGVGTGIFVSAETIAVGNLFGLHSPAMWLLLGLVALLFSVLAWPALKRRPAAPARAKAGAESAVRDDARTLGVGRLVFLYGLAGLGYIVTATYLPLFVRDALGAIDPAHIWAVFGLGAAPSCFFWHAVNQRQGARRSLALNLFLQAIGVALPAVSHTPPAYLASAILVGGSFVGVVTIAMPAARRLAARVRFNMMAAMTAAYGVGQIAGPLIADVLYRYNPSFTAPLLVAAAALLLGAGLCFPLKRDSFTMR